MKSLLTDSIVNVYTWEHINHKTTIWIGKNTQGHKRIIDAIRYKNDVQF